MQEPNKKFKVLDEKGITLVALVVTIIVLLILAGVSLSLVLGNNGVITKTQEAAFMQKISSYKEEMEMNIVGITNEEMRIKNKIIALNHDIEKYIPSIIDEDIGKYAIIGGELYYFGDNRKEIECCKKLGIITENINYQEELALENAIKEKEEAEYIGDKLYDKNFENGSVWKIINEVEDNHINATYGTDWYYIEAGTYIEGIGKCQDSFIVNYKLGKVVKFDTTKHVLLQYGANLAVQHDIVLNIDPINMEGNTQTSWGNNIELKGFSFEGDYDQEGNLVSGWYGTGIKLDGKDDEIIFNAGDDFSKGFTLSFYGKKTSDTMYYFSKNREEIVSSCRFYMTNSIYLFNMTKNMAYSKWSTDDSRRNNGNLKVSWKENIKSEEDVYVDCVYDPEKNEFSLYKNGVFEDSATVASEYWDGGNILEYGGKQIFEDETIPCRIGSFFGGDPEEWRYGKLDFYSVRLYKCALTKDEIIENYNATVAYHEMLVNETTN